MDMMEATIQQLLAPVVMISACGLLCMAMYNRLSSIVARLRQFHHERYAALTRISRGSGSERATLLHRSDGLEKQAHAMLDRARLIRNTLVCLVGCVACMLVSSLSLGLAMWIDSFQMIAFGLFVVGVGSMLAGMMMALLELRLALGQVMFEHEDLENLAGSIADTGGDM